LISDTPVSLVRNLAAAEKSESESEGGQKFPACRQAGFPPTPFLFARPSVQFLPREARQSVGVSFKKGSDFVKQTHQSKFSSRELKNLRKFGKL